MGLWKSFPAPVLFGTVLAASAVLIAGEMTAWDNDTDVIRVGAFSDERPGTQPPSGWESLTYPKIPAHTRYELVREDIGVVVKASSRASASGLTRSVRIDPRRYPVIRWRWKVANILEGADVNRKDGDDYPARIYITFEYDPDRSGVFERLKYETARLIYGRYPPYAAVSYIWESRTPVGTVVPNAYSDRLMMIVTESGAQKLNTWVEETRNLYEDYKAAFGREPPMISGVAVMTDTDDTGESATAWYGDITFQSGP